MSVKKVLMGQIGLDGHEMGAIAVTHALRDAGKEVVYLGLCQTPENIVKSAIEEDVDVIGVSSMSAIHDEAIPDLLKFLKDEGIGEVPVLVGGIIPNEDIPVLLQAGVKAVFPSGSSTAEIVNFVNSL